jgi:hypothetical protein
MSKENTQAAEQFVATINQKINEYAAAAQMNEQQITEAREQAITRGAAEYALQTVNASIYAQAVYTAPLKTRMKFHMESAAVNFVMLLLLGAGTAWVSAKLAKKNENADVETAFGDVTPIEASQRPAKKTA